MRFGALPWATAVREKVEREGEKAQDDVIISWTEVG